MSVTCKTCGGEVPNHKPSYLDPNGNSHPGHRVSSTGGLSSEEFERIGLFPVEEFIPGEQIYHPIYGKGTVLPNDPIEYVNVQFESREQPMKLNIAYAKLTRDNKE